MNRSIRHLAIVILAVLGLMSGWMTWLQVIVGPDFRDDPRNVRVAAALAAKERGPIITADGVVIAQSTADPDDRRVFRRTYPEGDLYSHVVGYSTLLFGDRGLEAGAAEILSSGQDSTISSVFTALTGGDLAPKGLRLTIDHDLQAAAAAALGDQPGAVVVIDASTGAVLAMVSSPTFDPNELLGGQAGTSGTALEADPLEPLLNRATAATYPPGSTFKVITAAAALETGVAGTATAYDDVIALELPTSTAVIRNFNRRTCGDGTTVTLQEAFIKSCNTTFGAIGLDLGAEALVAGAEGFGFNLEVPFDFDVEPSAIPGPVSFLNDVPGIAQSAIGQRDVRATPLGMALTAAAVANDGVIMVPYIVDAVFEIDGDVTEITAPATWQRAMSPATAGQLAELMEQVVTSGTGRGAAVPGARIGGKTGTAEVPGESPHAWFIGFGPIQADETPPIAIAVVVENGGDFGES
ncbi:MAG: penicillin-binding protein 2, partial [Acidimicrobiia bacterium]|nr:penicillin-binding protein 2 [Acidimicrobiia bacterium]